MKYIDKIKNLDKQEVYVSYSRIIRNFKGYENISKVKMLNEIYKFYQTEDDLIELCTEKELRYLKKLINGDTDCQDGHKYFFEIENLEKKFIIFKDPEISIAEDIYNVVCSALKKVKWNIVKENDRITELLVGICRCYGSISDQVLIELGTKILGLSTKKIIDYLCSNNCFYFYVCFNPEVLEDIGKEIAMFDYFDYFELKDTINERRKKYGFAYSGEIDTRDFKNMFYYGFNINVPIVKKLYNKLLEYDDFGFLLYSVETVSILYEDTNCLRSVFTQLIGADEELFNLIDEAVNEMPSPVLNSGSPNEYKYSKYKKAVNEYEREVNYVKQGDACLSKKEVKDFYKVYFGLLDFTNKKYNVNSKIKRIYKQQGINPGDIIDIVEKFWNYKDIIIDEFIKINPYRFGNYEKSLVMGFKRGFYGTFIIGSFLEDYTCFVNDNKCYMVKGINDNIDNIISYKKLPYVVYTGILPFNGKIIYDSIFRSFDGIKFGSNFDDIVKNEVENSERIYKM